MLFDHRTGLAQARLIVSPQPGTAEGLKQERLARLRSMDKKASITYEKTLEVNGFPVLSVRLNASPDTRKPVVIWSYLYGDEERSVELFAVVEPGVLSRLIGDINEMLNGLDLAYSAEPVLP